MHNFTFWTQSAVLMGNFTFWTESAVLMHNFTFWTQSAVLMRNFTFYFDSFSTDWTWWGHISFFFSRDVQAGPQYTDRAGQGPIREGRWDGPQSTDGK